MDYEQLAQELRRIREDAGLNLAQLAERMEGVTASAVGHWESLRRKPSLPVVDAWARACGYEAEMVFRRAGDAETLTALLRAASPLPGATVRLLARIADLLRDADPEFLVTLGIEVGLHEARRERDHR